ncbi:TMV resistance protein N-like [Abrus precatorius]|uniref:ADP-ribosyl cyclase/cyclic ADP-ribose hydrolase n=1 Tax=Abrus precatorius TaxID=3816 RepID=A0A8B8JYM9_ABRPR|nr:TMV resistance protein N-like [Abrus precatorius]
MSSSSLDQWIHDVFLSFRGRDTRWNFVSHLYAALSNAGIRTFLDDEKLDRGTELEPELLRAIEGSRICIVVFSHTYAESSWCLMELEKIMECHETIGQEVMPVFHDVDPCDVRNQTGIFQEAFEGHAIGYSGVTDVLLRWKRALKNAANLAGWHAKSFKSENMLVKEIVDCILRKVENRYMSIPSFPVGLSSRAQDVILFLEARSRTTSIVGIWGMGGSGKTAIAKAVYNQIHHKFEDTSFLQNVREACEKPRGQIDLQEQLLCDIDQTRRVKILDDESGKTMIKERLCSRRILIVLDDINSSGQLNALCGDRNWVGRGSIIIVTTRDVHILNVLTVDYVYEVKEMNNNESLELFNWHAFKGKSPREDFVELSRHVVAYCRGLPLALEVIGSCLYQRTKEQWKSVISKLKRIPNHEIQQKLKISYDGLNDDTEREIFLDICCFFIGKDRAYVTDILNGCDFYAEIGITVLIERCLLKVEYKNKLGMHGLLRDMGREIIRQESKKNPETRSRLWFQEDVLNVLTEDSGTKDVKGLALKLPRNSKACFKTKAFKKMKNLRVLQLDYVQLTGNYGYLSKRLRWVHWHGFPSTCLPSEFCLENLVAIDLRHSNLKIVWKEPQLLERLKFLNLSHSRSLTKTPDFSTLPNLEKLILKHCPSLSEVHQSIGDLRNILLINLKDCTRLGNLPRNIYKLKSLKTLVISGCSKIDKVEEDIVQMESLTTLLAKGTAIKQVPLSIIRKKGIGYVSLCGYEGLSHDIFPSIIWSWMSPKTNALSRSCSFWDISSTLVSIDLQNINLGDILLILRGLSRLQSVRVQFCSQNLLYYVYDEIFTVLQATSDVLRISGHSLRSLWIGMGSYHQFVITLCKCVPQGFTTNESGSFSLPGDNYPYWSTHKGHRHSILFKVPQVNDYHMKGMILHVVCSSMLESVAADCRISVLIINYTKYTIQLYNRGILKSFNDQEWNDIISNLGPGDKVKIFVALGHGLTVKKTVVFLLYGQ